MKAFVIHATDNVATALDPLEAGRIDLLGARPGALQVYASIREGHKVSMAAIAKGQPVMKYGIRIGHASEDIPMGTWVHLHNLQSDYDERSQTLDGDTGAPTEDVYV